MFRVRRMAASSAACGPAKSLIQATLDLIQAGDVEPTSAAIATIAGVSSRALFQHFTSLADLYAAAFDLAVEPRLRPHPSGRQRRAAAKPHRSSGLGPLRAVRGVAAGMALRRTRALRRAGRRSRALPSCAGCCASAWLPGSRPSSAISTPASRDLVLDSLDLAFGLDSWMNMREQLRLSPVHASRTWRFTAEAIVLQALTVPNQPVAVA